MDHFGDAPSFLKMLAALAFVIVLMGGLALALKKLGLSGAVSTLKGAKRLRLIEALPLDARRRLVLLERDNVQHLVILGVNTETLIETGIIPPPPLASSPQEEPPHDA